MAQAAGNALVFEALKRRCEAPQADAEGRT
jgi:hypothetical protein